MTPDQMDEIVKAKTLDAKEAWSMTCEAEAALVKEELASVEETIRKASSQAMDEVVWWGPAMPRKKLSTLKRILRNRGFVVAVKEGDVQSQIAIKWEQR